MDKDNKDNFVNRNVCCSEVKVEELNCIILLLN